MLAMGTSLPCAGMVVHVARSISLALGTFGLKRKSKLSKVLHIANVRADLGAERVGALFPVRARAVPIVGTVLGQVTVVR